MVLLFVRSGQAPTRTVKAHSVTVGATAFNGIHMFDMNSSEVPTATEDYKSLF